MDGDGSGDAVVAQHEEVAERRGAPGQCPRAELAGDDRGRHRQRRRQGVRALHRHREVEQGQQRLAGHPEREPPAPLRRGRALVRRVLPREPGGDVRVRAQGDRLAEPLAVDRPVHQGEVVGHRQRLANPHGHGREPLHLIRRDAAHPQVVQPARLAHQRLRGVARRLLEGTPVHLEHRQELLELGLVERQPSPRTDRLHQVGGRAEVAGGLDDARELPGPAAGVGAPHGPPAGLRGLDLGSDGVGEQSITLRSAGMVTSTNSTQEQ